MYLEGDVCIGNGKVLENLWLEFTTERYFNVVNKKIIMVKHYDVSDIADFEGWETYKLDAVFWYTILRCY